MNGIDGVQGPVGPQGPIGPPVLDGIARAYIKCKSLALAGPYMHQLYTLAHPPVFEAHRPYTVVEIEIDEGK